MRDFIFNASRGALSRATAFRFRTGQPDTLHLRSSLYFITVDCSPDRGGRGGKIDLKSENERATRRMSHHDFCISVARGFIFCRFQSVSLRDRDYDVNSCKSVPVAEQVSDARSRSSIHLVATSERKNQQGGNGERKTERYVGGGGEEGKRGRRC